MSDRDSLDAQYDGDEARCLQAIRQDRPARPGAMYAALALLLPPVGYWLYLAGTSASSPLPDWYGAAGCLVLALLFMGLLVGLHQRNRVAFLVAAFLGGCGFVTQGPLAFRISAAVYGTTLLLVLWQARSAFGFRSQRGLLSRQR